MVISFLCICTLYSLGEHFSQIPNKNYLKISYLLFINSCVLSCCWVTLSFPSFVSIFLICLFVSVFSTIHDKVKTGLFIFPQLYREITAWSESTRLCSAVTAGDDVSVMKPIKFALTSAMTSARPGLHITSHRRGVIPLVLF